MWGFQPRTLDDGGRGHGSESFLEVLAQVVGTGPRLPDEAIVFGQPTGRHPDRRLLGLTSVAFPAGAGGQQGLANLCMFHANGLGQRRLRQIPARQVGIGLVGQQGLYQFDRTGLDPPAQHRGVGPLADDQAQVGIGASPQQAPEGGLVRVSGIGVERVQHRVTEPTVAQVVGQHRAPPTAFLVRGTRGQVKNGALPMEDLDGGLGHGWSTLPNP